MRHVGLLAFGITTAVLVPAALQRLTAGPTQIAKLVAPGARSIELAGTKIDVALDRAIVDPGDTVHLTLTASTAGDEPVKVAVLLMESEGSGGGRVETPPRRIARETVTFAAGATGARHELAFKLRGHRGDEMDGVAQFGRYTILVMAPKAADQLDRLRRRATRVDNPMDDASGRYDAWSTAYYGAGNDDAGADDDGDDGDRDDNGSADGGGSGSGSGSAEKFADKVADQAADAAATDEPDAAVGTPGQAARLEVLTRPAGSPVALHVPDTAPVGQPFTVAVTVKNPGKKPITHLGVRLAMPALYGLEYRGLSDDQLAIAPELATIDLGPRQARTVEFQVTAKAAGTAGLYASTSCDDSDDWQACQVILDGQLDATDVVAPIPTETAGATATVARLGP